MTTEGKGSSGAQGQAGGDGSDGQGNEGTGSVSYESHQRLLNEKKKVQEEARALKAQLEEKNRKEQELQEKEMKDKEEWKKISELREKELAETKAKLTDFEVSILNSKKASAFLGELSKLGVTVRPQYYDLIDVSKIIVDPVTNEVDSSSTVKYAKTWATEHYELAKATNPNSKMPGSAPQGGSQLTYKDWLELPLVEQKKRMKEVREADMAAKN